MRARSPVRGKRRSAVVIGRYTSRLMLRSLMTAARPSRMGFGSITPTTVHQPWPMWIVVPSASAYPNRSCFSSEPRTQTALLSWTSKDVTKRPWPTRKLVTSWYSGLVPTTWPTPWRASKRTSWSRNLRGTTPTKPGTCSRMRSASS